MRAVIVTPEVETENLAEGAVGYIRLSGFSDHAAEQFDAAVAAAVERGQRALIVDLRGNPGGYVTAARDIASQFLADGPIFWQEYADGSLVETVALPGGAATDPSIKVVALVDGGSASASEIVAGALHDRGRATLVGSKTFGKGTVQQWTQLEDDHGGFRLTTAKWLTPGQDVDPRDGHRARRRRGPDGRVARRRPGHRRRRSRCSASRRPAAAEPVATCARGVLRKSTLDRGCGSRVWSLTNERR